MSTAIELAYLIASVLFVLGMKMMNKTKSARQGNRLSALGMFIAILATLVQIDAISLVEILGCIVVGSAIGMYYANKVEMTKMPEMVAIFNGFGGLASFSVALSDYFLRTEVNVESIALVTVISIIISVFIGGLTFTGSLIAYLKLNGNISGSPITFKGQHAINLLLFLGFLTAAVFT
ncbi:MAG: NAD(P)(+) transhydrogenase (Re/Si-specific) subunit beta, partial [Algoriphagus sp.]